MGASQFGKKLKDGQVWAEIWQDHKKRCWGCVMNAEDTERLQACVQEIAAILYRHTPAESLTSLEGIEQSVRQHMLD